MERWNSYPACECDQICGGNNYIEFSIQPETPMEPLEFLSRSWSLSAAEVSKALFAQQTPKHKIQNNTISPVSESSLNIAPQSPSKVSSNYIQSVRKPTRGKYWFNQNKKEGGITRRKDKVRAEKAKTHAALCIAGLATALASITSSARLINNGDDSRMSNAIGSATELLATHCSELAEMAGADHHLLVSILQSAVNTQTPSHLITLTAAAATALRGEAALKARFPKEAKKNAAVIPHDDGMSDVHSKYEHYQFYTQDTLQQLHKGGLRWKQVSVYINNKSEIVIKLKSKHIGGAFSTKSKGIVYGLCNDKASWTERKNSDTYFGVKTAKGVLEFKCKNKIHKLKWVDTIQYLLQRTNNIENITHSMSMLTA